MARRTDRPLLQVRISFETTRTGRQHLIEAYARLVPTVRRLRKQPNRGDTRLIKAKIATGTGGEA
jgi:hypothetical protein